MISRTIKYESELCRDFTKEVTQQALGEKFLSCIQCGTCSSTCPVSHFMDYTPRRIIAMTREGFKEEVLNSYTIWICASCYSCTVECPKNIEITEIMYALKQRAIKDDSHPEKYPIPVLAREFFSMIKKYGRSSESWLLFRLFLKTNPLKLFKQNRIGIGLFSRGRLSLRQEKIKDRKSLRAIFDAISESDQ
jgi:quinone-modifying oxidoreductase subunit QmoC